MTNPFIYTSPATLKKIQEKRIKKALAGDKKRIEKTIKKMVK
jgi:hypothetical protein